MKKIYFLLIFLAVFTGVDAQQQEYFPENNSFNYLYKQRRIKESRYYAHDYKIWFFNVRYLEKIQDFDRLGNLVREREYYDRDRSDGWEIFYYYNRQSQLISNEWYWLDDKRWQKTSFGYNIEGKLISMCDSSKYGNETYSQDSCMQILYNKGEMKLVIRDGYDTTTKYVKDGNRILSYHNGNLAAAFANDLKIKYYTAAKVYTYLYNERGQLVRTVINDYNGQQLGSVIFKYKKGLPFKEIFIDTYLGTKEIYRYRYKRY